MKANPFSKLLKISPWSGSVDGVTSAKEFDAPGKSFEALFPCPVCLSKDSERSAISSDVLSASGVFTLKIVSMGAKRTHTEQVLVGCILTASRGLIERSGVDLATGKVPELTYLPPQASGNFPGKEKLVHNGAEILERGWRRAKDSSLTG